MTNEVGRPKTPVEDRASEPIRGYLTHSEKAALTAYRKQKNLSESAAVRLAVNRLILSGPQATRKQA
jgi:hypothetical protein